MLLPNPSPEPTPAVPPIRTPWYLDKGVYVTILAPLIGLLMVYVNSKLPIPADPNTVTNVVAGGLVLAATYVAGHKWKTGMLTKTAMQLAANDNKVTTVATAVDALRQP